MDFILQNHLMGGGSTQDANPSAVNPMYPIANVQESSSSSTILLIVIVVLIILLICIVLYFIFKKKKVDKTTIEHEIENEETTDL